MAVLATRPGDQRRALRAVKRRAKFFHRLVGKSTGCIAVAPCVVWKRLCPPFVPSPLCRRNGRSRGYDTPTEAAVVTLSPNTSNQEVYVIRSHVALQHPPILHGSGAEAFEHSASEQRDPAMSKAAIPRDRLFSCLRRVFLCRLVLTAALFPAKGRPGSRIFQPHVNNDGLTAHGYGSDRGYSACTL
jgi:hypothetical protein